MRIIVTSSCDIQNAERLSQVLLLAGHEVLFQPNENVNSFQPDVVICFGRPMVVPGSFHVQVVRWALESVQNEADFYVFSNKSNVPLLFEKRYAVIPFAVDTNKFCPCSVSNSKTIIALGKLNPAKGHKTLIQAMTLVDEKITAVIAGQEDFYTIEQMSDFAELMGVKHRISFPGKVGDVNSLLNSASVGIVTSLGNQQVSNAAMEIMSSGIPLLAAATGGLCDLVIDGVTGLIHSPGNWRQLAGQINHIMTNHGLADELSVNARNYCEKHLSFNTVGKMWTQLLEQLCFS